MPVLEVGYSKRRYTTRKGFFFDVRFLKTLNMISAVILFDLLDYKFGVKIVVVLVIPETNESLHLTHFVAWKDWPG
jgi:hypothetical protein